MESLVDKGEKTAGDGDQQTPAIPMCTMSNSAARVNGLFILSAMNGLDLI